jgi:DNA mismatch repair protein MutS2
LIGLGNDLAIAQSMVLEEERRILQELTDAVGENAEEILAGLEAVAQLDEAEACARLSNDLHAYTPELISPREPFDLRGLRHPLLVLQGKQVVASDVRLDAPARALIISGPNAGGKTVTLSSIGLCSLMVRLGLPIPAREGSRLPLYPGVYAAIGDAQNLDRDLSTFSAHVTALRDILDRASPGSLVLIDEIAADTDPREGAALAASVLEALLERGSTILVTTHLDELKALGLTDPRCANAHVGFDADRLAPTYRLHLGSPGASSAIEIARRVGLSEVICERARASLQGKAGPLTKALESLEATRAAVDRERAEAARLREEAQLQRDEARRQVELIERQTRAEMEAARRKLLSDLEAAQVQVSELVAELQLKPGLARAAEVQHQLRQRESVQKRELEPRPAPSSPGDREEVLRVGGRVRLTKLNREGQLLELHGDEAVVQAGAVRMRVATRDLVGLEARKSASKASAAGHGASPGPAAAARKLIPESCDLRGLRADEALRLVEAFLDRVYGEGAAEAVIIHGHGTGALKASVRDYLTASPYLSGWKPSPDDGSTEVTLKGG